MKQMKLDYIISNFQQLDKIRKNARLTFENYLSIDVFEKKLLKVIETIQ